MDRILLAEIVLLCLNGGIYDHTFALYGAVFSAGLLTVAKRHKEIRIPLNITSYGIGAIFLGYVISIFVANDRGMAFIGCIRMVMMAGFWLLWNNLKPIYREQIISRLPDTAALLTAMTVLLYSVPAAKEYLYRAGRMGGVFQYSNTYAVFLLVSLVILFYREKRDCREYAKAGVLVAGIVFCGSRSVLVLAVAVILYLLISDQENRKRWLWILGITLVFCACVQTLMGLDVERLGKMTLDSSTLNGRFLYWQDSLPVIAANPLGLGYMGYYYLQPQFQTGNYVTRFVHNDILQMGLDAGVIPMIALAVMIVGNVWRLNHSANLAKEAEGHTVIHDLRYARCRQVVLVILAVRSLFDFDLQFGVMFLVMLMCMDGGKEKVYKWNGKCACAVCTGVLIVCIYFSIALGISRLGMNEASLAWYPLYTEAREVAMQEQEGGEYAEILIEANGMLAEAYEYAAKGHLESGEYLEALEDVQGMLKTAGYGIRYYNQAVYDLSICLDMAVRSEDYEGVKRILEEIRGVPGMLEDLREQTSGLAYRIHDKPVFELDEEIREYIENLSGVSLT